MADKASSEKLAYRTGLRHGALIGFLALAAGFLAGWSLGTLYRPLPDPAITQILKAKDAFEVNSKAVNRLRDDAKKSADDGEHLKAAFMYMRCAEAWAVIAPAQGAAGRDAILPDEALALQEFRKAGRAQLYYPLLEAKYPAQTATHPATADTIQTP